MRKAQGRMAKEFRELKKLIRLNRYLRLRVVRGMRSDGYFCPYTFTVALRSDAWKASNVYTLLHELCHARQHRDGTLMHYWDSLAAQWRLEREAYDFAEAYYRAIYRDRLGDFKLDLRQHYHFYRTQWYKMVRRGRVRARACRPRRSSGIARRACPVVA